MSIYPKIIVVEKYDKDSNKSIWKLLILHKKGGKWVDFTSIKFNSWLKANAYKENIEQAIDTDKLSVEKLQEELESCIQTLIEASVAATITQDIVVGNLVDRKLADLAKTHKLAVDYIEKVTGKNIDVVLAENAALEAEEENE